MVGMSQQAPLPIVQGAALSPDGRRIAIVPHLGQALIFDLDNPDHKLRLEGQPGLGSVAFSADGKWVATGNWQGQSGVKVWDARTGALEKALPDPHSTHVAFSPDGHWLVTSTGQEYQFVEVSSWRLVRRIARERAG